MEFRDVYVFLIVLLVPIFHRSWVRRNQPPSVRYSVPVPKDVRGSNPVSYLVTLRYVALALMITALARPQSATRYLEKTVNGIDIGLVLDISASMNIEDLAESSRLDVAKQTISDFIKGREVDRIGLVVFSGEAVTLSPPTLDYGLVFANLETVRTGVLKDGTAIGDGLSVAVNRLRNSNAKSKVIILLTDGDNNVGQIDPATAGELAADNNIKVYTIAVGKEGRVKLPIPHKVGGTTITTYQWFDNALNPELLQHISSVTSGKFYRVTDAGALASVFKEIDSLEKTEVKSKERYLYNELFQKPLVLALIFLLIEWFLNVGWWRVFP